TRPFEGLVATLLSAALLWLLWGDRGCLPKLQLALRATAVAAVPVAGALSLIALQNYAISGQISRMPYALHEQQYGVAPLFVFGQPQVPAIERGDDLPATIRAYHHGWSLQSYQQRAGLTGWLRGVREACWTLASYWVALALIPLLTAAYWLPFRLPRLLALAVAIQLLLSSSVCWIFPHYLSPVVPWLAALTVLGFRRILRAFRQPACGLPRPRLRTAHYASGVLLAQSILLALAVGPLRNGPQREWALRRAAIEAGLSKLEGRHLVLVKYAAEHNVHQEWVYNGADLARGKVLWARDERRDWNQRLAEQYADDRFIWTLAPDQPEAKPRLIPAPHKNQPSGNPSPLR
ncbi:MAG: hypothetical protein KDA45_07795, partial [Planctomycetales bacterium]|nr:hypothetical protein [Planctomycetales bacterium]